jgi:hypothetical protein
MDQNIDILVRIDQWRIMVHGIDVALLKNQLELIGGEMTICYAHDRHNGIFGWEFKFDKLTCTKEDKLLEIYQAIARLRHPILAVEKIESKIF